MVDNMGINEGVGCADADPAPSSCYLFFVDSAYPHLQRLRCQKRGAVIRNETSKFATNQLNPAGRHELQEHFLWVSANFSRPSLL